MKKFIIGVCEGRHPLPVENYVFGQEVNPLDVVGLENQADEFIKTLLVTNGVKQCAYDATADRFYNVYFDVEEIYYEASMVIYVTGLTVALMAIVKSAIRRCVKVTLMHYNKEVNEYYPQVIQDFYYEDEDD